MRDDQILQTTPASMVLTDIVERHAQQAAFLWELRRAAVRSPAYDLEALDKLDERVDAHLDGLRIAGNIGWEICEAALADAEGGEAFTATVLAIEQNDVRSLARILSRTVHSAELVSGIVSAFGWVPFSKAKRFLDELLAGDAPPELHYFGIAGFALHRHDPGERLAHAASADDLHLRARALRAIGELGRVTLLPVLQREIDAEDEVCRFWAAWSSCLLGDPSAADVLWQLAREGGVLAERACGVAIRRMDPTIARTRIREFSGAPMNIRSALAGGAALGDSSMIPWVIDCMRLADHARFAGWTFTMITGADLNVHKLAGGAPKGFRAGPTDEPEDPDVTPDRDAGLAWPDIDAVNAWWARNGAALPAGRRSLKGKPIERDWLWQVLRSGGQPAREAAAIELFLLSRGKPLFEVRAPGFRQMQMLSEL